MMGALPTALLLGRYKGIDIRKQGSGNVGATNAFRVLGPKMGATCLVVDMLKGGLPTLLLPAMLGNPHPGFAWGFGIAAIAGHMFSPFLNFKGGKGVATSLGVVLAIAPFPLLIVFAIGIIMIGSTGYVSLASITGSLALPILIYLLGTHNEPARQFGLSVIITAILGLLIIWKHRSNIGRLLAGTENKILRKDKKTSPASEHQKEQ